MNEIPKLKVSIPVSLDGFMSMLIVKVKVTQRVKLNILLCSEKGSRFLAGVFALLSNCDKVSDDQITAIDTLQV